MTKIAKLKYLPNNFQIIEDGTRKRSMELTKEFSAAQKLKH